MSVASIHTFASILSGALLSFCYPQANFSWLAWILLAPFFYATAQAQTRRRAIWLGWIFTLSFFGVSLHFLTHVAFAAWPALALLESLYGILLGALLFEVRRFEKTRWRILWVALVWVVVEFLRAEIPVWGFGHNLLASSQAFHPEMLQLASWGGAYLLSFVMVIGNGLIAEAMPGIKGDRQGNVRQRICFVLCFLSLVLFIYGFGSFRLHNLEKKSAPTLRLAVIQPNIPQSAKWDLMAKQDVIEIHENLTRLAALREPELLIWPEASFPGYLNADIEAPRIFELVRSLGFPVLIGSPYWQSETRVFNSVFLVESTGFVRSQYDKMRLVPFGEYIPWKWVLGWLSPLAYTMGVGDFTAGDKQTFFEVNGHRFAVLICFEDVFPDLARVAVNKGATFLTVVTNDAWFGKTGALWQHFQASILRAVENGVPLVRAANTGVSGFVSAEGRILNVVRNAQGESRFVTGELTFELPLAKHQTVYQKGGWLFAHGCVIFLGVLYLLKRKGASL